jgi:hypothetical protein
MPSRQDHPKGVRILFAPNNRTIPVAQISSTRKLARPVGAGNRVPGDRRERIAVSSGPGIFASSTTRPHEAIPSSAGAAQSSFGKVCSGAVRASITVWARLSTACASTVRMWEWWQPPRRGDAMCEELQHEYLHHAQQPTHHPALPTVDELRRNRHLRGVGPTILHVHSSGSRL